MVVLDIAVVNTALSAIAADDKFAPAYYELGMVYVRMGKNADAKTNLQKYLELEPSGKESRDMAWAATDVGDDPARCDVAELVGICRCNGVVSGPDSMLGHVTNAR